MSSLEPLQAVLSGDEMVLSAGPIYSTEEIFQVVSVHSNLIENEAHFTEHRKYNNDDIRQVQNYSTPSNRSGSRKNIRLELDYFLD